MTNEVSPIPDDWWPCACMKRSSNKPGSYLKSIKMNAPSVKRCRKCGSTPLSGEARGGK